MNQAGEDSAQPIVPLSANARRVLGVLLEKAKTTPDSYPLTAAGLIAGSNQKSNRSPQMKLEEGDVLIALDELRQVGAAREIHGSGRVLKYRHAAYQWLDLDNPQAAVMTELLLRGPQTVGELRSRASRMYDFASLDAVKTTLSELEAKNLAQPVTPAGRGQVFAHQLYPPEEQPRLNAKVEKLTGAAGETNTSPALPNEHKQQIDQLIERLDAVTGRIDELEERLKRLEN